MDFAVASHLSAVAEGDIVVHLSVVRDMHTFHEEVAVADAGFAISKSGTVYHHILAEDILVADDERGLCAVVIEVLWLSAEHRVLIYFFTSSEPCATHDAGVREDDAVVTDYHIVLDVGKWVDSDVLANLCARCSVCLIAYHNCFPFYIIQLVSASPEGIVEAYDSLHLVEIISHFRELCIEKALLSCDYFKVCGRAIVEQHLVVLHILLQACHLLFLKL